MTSDQIVNVSDQFVSRGQQNISWGHTHRRSDIDVDYLTDIGLAKN